MPGEFFFFSLASFVSPVLSLILLMVVVVAIGSTRGQADPQGHRLTATYLCVVLFLSLFTALFAATAAMGSFMDLTRSDDEASIGIDHGSAGFDETFDHEGDEGDEGIDVSDDGESSHEDAVGHAVQALAIAAVAAGVLVYHRRRLLELTEKEGFRDGPAATIVSAYLYTTSLVGLVAFAVGASMALYAFARVVAPGALSSDDADLVREDGGRQLFTGAFLALAALAVVVVHHRERGRLAEPTVDEEPIP